MEVFNESSTRHVVFEAKRRRKVVLRFANYKRKRMQDISKDWVGTCLQAELTSPTEALLPLQAEEAVVVT